MQRGDIVYIQMTEGVGGEIGGLDCRPAIIVSNDAANRFSPVIEVVYLTTRRKKNLPTHVFIKSSPKPSTAMCEQVSSVSKQRIYQSVGAATQREMEQIDQALRISLGLEERSTP